MSESESHQAQLRAALVQAMQPLAAACENALPGEGPEFFAETVDLVLGEWARETGRDVVHEWRVTGQPDGDYPPYDFTWRSDANEAWSGSGAEQAARTFIAHSTSGWTDVRLRHRVVITGSWTDAAPVSASAATDG